MSETIVVEFDGSRHETTVEEAPALLRRLKRESLKAAAEREAHSKAAALEASDSYRRLVDRCADHHTNGCAINWTIGRPDSENDYARRCYARFVHPGEYPRTELRADTGNGSAATMLYNRAVSAVVEDGAGFLVAARLVDSDGESDPWWVSVGVSGPIVHLAAVSQGLSGMIDSACADREAAQAAG